MPDRPNLTYQYDGSLNGLLCCVFESYVQREVPSAIRSEEEEQETLYPVKEIRTEAKNAKRIDTSIRSKMGEEAAGLIHEAFLNGSPDKGMAIYRFVRKGYQYGRRTVHMLGDSDVSRIHRLAQAVRNERHLLLEFVRFSEYEGGLVSEIEPKHFVLPLMQGHFCSRYPEERFLIYDKTHEAALIYQPYEAHILPITQLELPQEGEIRQEYRRLWKRYYDSIAIRERENPRCRMGHMPKRFWNHMLEMEQLVQPQFREPSGPAMLKKAEEE